MCVWKSGGCVDWGGKGVYGCVCGKVEGVWIGWGVGG